MYLQQVEHLISCFLSQIEDSGRNYYSVPPLGKHYSERQVTVPKLLDHNACHVCVLLFDCYRWAEEDLYEEQRDNCRITDRKSKSSVLVDRSSTGILSL